MAADRSSQALQRGPALLGPPRCSGPRAARAPALLEGDESLASDPLPIGG
jgi:hypothetical protein